MFGHATDVLDTLVHTVMDTLRQVREHDAEIEMHMAPVTDTYAVLLKYDACVLGREEMDRVSELKSRWAAIKLLSEQKADELIGLQVRSSAVKGG